MQETIHFKVKDQNMIDSEMVGETLVDYSALCFNNGCDDWYKLYSGNDNVGKLRLLTVFEEDQGDIHA